ncbi:hypothetical protein DDD64_08530, partial [Actinotignum sanguinis]
AHSTAGVKEASLLRYSSSIRLTFRCYGRANPGYETHFLSINPGMTFGALSRLIAASGESGVLDEIAKSLSTSRRTLPSQIRSFVYLRNRCAHCSKLWNHSVLDAPGLLPNIERRAKKTHGQFSPRSVYKIFVAMDELTSKVGIATGWLTHQIDPLLHSSPLLSAGIKTPARYGEFDVSRFG